MTRLNDVNMSGGKQRVWEMFTNQQRSRSLVCTSRTFMSLLLFLSLDSRTITSLINSFLSHSFFSVLNFVYILVCQTPSVTSHAEAFKRQRNYNASIKLITAPTVSMVCVHETEPCHQIQTIELMKVHNGQWNVYHFNILTLKC